MTGAQPLQHPPWVLTTAEADQRLEHLVERLDCRAAQAATSRDSELAALLKEASRLFCTTVYDGPPYPSGAVRSTLTDASGR